MSKPSRYINGWFCALCGHDNPDEQSPCADLDHCEVCRWPRGKAAPTEPRGAAGGKQTFRVEVVHDVPAGATHYTGDLRDEDDPPTWWKYQINSTGACRDWCWYRAKPDRALPVGWYIHGSHPPHFLKEIPA